MIPLAVLKRHLQITSVNFDDMLQTYIRWSQDAIEGYCEQPIAPQSVVVQVQNNIAVNTDANVLYAASLQGRNSLTAAWTTLALSEYIFDLERRVFSITTAYQYYQASIFLGFSVIPSAVERVCYEMCKEMAQNDGLLGGESTFRVTSIAKSKGGDTTTSSLKDLSSAHKALLNPYRIVHIR